MADARIISADIRAPLCLALQALVTATLICSTDRHALHRKGALVPLLYLNWLSIKAASSFTSLAVIWMGFTSFVFPLHCFTLLCIRPLDEVDIMREMKKTSSINDAKKPTWVDRVVYTTCMLFSLRGVNTAHQIKRLPLLPENEASNRFRFILQQLKVLVLKYLVIDLLLSQEQPPEMRTALARGKEWLWLPLNPYSVTWQDLQARILSTVMSWYLIGPFMIDLYYRVFAVIWVCTGVSKPSQWPPLYGSYSECYTLRRYFNKFWHQCNRIHLEAIGTFVTRDVLRLPPGLLRRYSTVFVCFFASGLHHLWMDLCMGVPDWRLSGGVTTFMLIAVGIVLEDTAQILWKRCLVLLGKRDEHDTFKKTVGYVWTFVWLVLVSPFYGYALQRERTDSTLVIPFSITKILERAWRK